MQVIPSTGISFGFTGTDILSNSSALVVGLASFVILAVAVAFAPRLISLIKGVFAEGGYDDDEEEEED